MDIIDCHTHIFPPEIIAKREYIITKDIRFASIYKGSQERLIDVAGLVEYMEGNRITSCIACGFPFMDSGLIKMSNDYVIEASRQDNKIIPFVVFDLDKRGNPINELERCQGNGATGIGEIGFYEKGMQKQELEWLDDAAYFAEKAGMPVILHVNEQIGHTYNGKIPVDFIGLTDFINRHPLLKLVLAHLGGGICFYEFMPEIRHIFANVYYDIAATPFIYSEHIYRYIGMFLSEKVLFGTDYPLLGPKRYLKGIKDMEKEAKENILHRNARRFLGIDRLG